VVSFRERNVVRRSFPKRNDRGHCATEMAGIHCVAETFAGRYAVASSGVRSASEITGWLVLGSALPAFV
jgi:hypothetical protein